MATKVHRWTVRRGRHGQLVALLDYRNFAQVRRCLMMLGEFYEAAQNGNMSALAIYTDLQQALQRGHLTELQRLAVRLVCLEHLSVSEAASVLGRDAATIHQHIDGATRHVQRVLLGDEGHDAK